MASDVHSRTAVQDSMPQPFPQRQKTGSKDGFSDSPKDQSQITTKNAPLYAQLCMDTKMWIDEKIYRPGDKLPTEREFCEMYKVSRATVRRALVELEKQGLITSRQGSGIFVAVAPLQQSLQRFYSFSAEMQKLGKKPSNKVLTFQEIQAPSQICKQLSLERGSTIYRIVRLRLADEVPYLYETTYFPRELMRGLTPEQLEFHNLYQVMEDQFGIVLHSAKESFQPALPNQVVAPYLGIKKTVPCMFFIRTTWDIHGRIVELTESYGRGDKFLFEVEMIK